MVKEQEAGVLGVQGRHRRRLRLGWTATLSRGTVRHRAAPRAHRLPLLRCRRLPCLRSPGLSDALRLRTHFSAALNAAPATPYTPYMGQLQDLTLNHTANLW